MVLSRISEGRPRGRYRKRASNYGIPRAQRNAKPPSNQNKSSRSISLTTAIANESFSSTSSSTDDTLSMISTPWSTETWRSETDTSSQAWTSSMQSDTSVEPKTTTTTSACASIDIKTGSNLTVTLLNEVLTPSVSRYVQPLNRQDTMSSPTYTSWSLETYTSTGLLSSYDRIKVNYPWSPSTYTLDLSDNYPSTPTLISQKGSREGFGKFEPKKFTPMNIILNRDDHPLLDWILVKQQGIPIRKE